MQTVFDDLFCTGSGFFQVMCCTLHPFHGTFNIVSGSLNFTFGCDGVFPYPFDNGREASLAAFELLPSGKVPAAMQSATAAAIMN